LALRTLVPAGRSLNGARDQIFLILRNLKWFAVISMLFVALLYVPDQVIELYRITAADANAIDLIVFFLSMLILSFAIWFGANLVALQSMTYAEGATGKPLLITARWFPVLLGVFPLIACGLGQFSARPVLLGDQHGKLDEIYNVPGGAFDNFDKLLAALVSRGLTLNGEVLLWGSAAFVVLCGVLSINYAPQFRRMNRAYFARFRFLALTAFLVLVAAAVLVWAPLKIPRVLGPFGLLAVFGVLVTAICTQVSLLTVRQKLPWIPVLLGLSLLFALADLNDNHEIRHLSDPPKHSGRDSASAEFTRWYGLRDDVKDFPRGDVKEMPKEYPIYIVAARGGGIYAAYQTAVFLSRMQDLCPRFQDHLFAISSVSGGSIGSAVFASALANVASPAEKATGCPKIERFLQRDPMALSSNLENPGPVERHVREMLSSKSDFLSPLLAYALFCDLVQRFLFFPLDFLDRARPLEYALEDAARRNSSTAGPIESEYMAHWDAGGSQPALIMNATDAASDRRIVFSPFTFGAETRGNEVDSLSFFQNLVPRGAASNAAPVNIRLSTAAFVSARFPWVSPAATVSAAANDPSPPAKTRMVDGGYFDNSGVDTAMDLVESLRGTIDQINEANAAQGLPRVALKLIALGGGTYATRSSFGLGEMLEPIRALLSTRESRGYIAMNRAAREMPAVKFDFDISQKQETVELKSFRAATLATPYYSLPLGWTMSDKTREIIERQSGRFWDCQAGRDFTQTDPSGSTADCVMVSVAAELGSRVEQSAKEVAVQNHYSEIEDSRPPAPPRLKLGEDTRCFSNVFKPSLRLTQVRLVQTILKEWDYHPELKDLRQLAYIVATAALETGNFRFLAESLQYRSASRIRAVFPRIPADEVQNYVNQPEPLANRLYAGRLGNRDPDDGWRYRGRGLLSHTGRANYQKLGALIKEPLEAEPDLLFNPSVSVRAMFAFFYPTPEVNSLAKFFEGPTVDWRGARKVVTGPVASGAEQIAADAQKFLSCFQANDHAESPKEP